MKQPEIDELLKKNPQIDIALLGENQKKIEQAKLGEQARSYGLELPYGGRRLTAWGGQHQADRPPSRLRT